MTTKAFFAVDLGSFSFKGLLAEVNQKRNSVEVLHMAEVQSHGLRRGIIFDIEDAARSLSELLSQFEEQYKKEITELNILIGGPCLETRFARGNIIVSRPDELIGEDDIKRVHEMVQTSFGLQNRTVLHVVPRYYVIDEVDKVKTPPIEMQGTRLSLEATVIDIFNQASLNLSKVLSIVGVQPNLIVAGPLATAKALVTKRDREQGVAALDIGAETTSLVVFEDDELLHLAVIPLGSQNITNDIANALKIHFDSAERIKIAFGSALESKVNKKNLIELSQFIEGEQESVAQKHVAEIIEARLSEILGFVNDELKKIDRASKLPAGLYVYGGGAELPYITNLIKKELKISVHKANLDHYSRYFNKEVKVQFFGVCSLLIWYLDSIMGERKVTYGSNIVGWFKKFIDSFLP